MNQTYAGFVVGAIQTGANSSEYEYGGLITMLAMTIVSGGGGGGPGVGTTTFAAIYPLLLGK